MLYMPVQMMQTFARFAKDMCHMNFQFIPARDNYYLATL